MNVSVIKCDIKAQLTRQNQQTVGFFGDFIKDYQETLAKSSKEHRQNLAYEDKFRTLITEAAEAKHRLESIQSKVVGGVSLGTISELEKKIEDLEESLSQSYRSNQDSAKHALDLTTALKAVSKELSEKEVLLSEERLKVFSLEADLFRLREEKSAMEMTLRVMREELQALQFKLIESQEQLTRVRRQHEELVQRWIRMKTAEAEKMNADLQEQSTRLKQSQMDERLTAAASSMEPIADELLKKGLIGKTPIALTGVPKSAKRVLAAHKAEANHLCYSSSGNLLVTCSNDKTVKIWDPNSGREGGTLKGCVQSVTRVDVSNSDEYILGACNDHSTRVWSFTRGGAADVLHTLTGHMGKVMGARFTVDSKRVVSGSHDRTIKVWNLDRGYCTSTIFCFSHCNDLALNPESTVIVSGHADNSIRLWDLRSGEAAHSLTTAHSRPITGVAYSPDSRFIATLSRDNAIKIFDHRNLETTMTLRDMGFHVGLNWTNISWSYDSSYVVAGSAEGNVWVWNLPGKKVARKLSGPHQKTVSATAWSPTGSQIASCDRDGTLVLWE